MTGDPLGDAVANSDSKEFFSIDLSLSTRLFLSVDILGSTKFKEEQNISRQFERYRLRKQLVTNANHADTSGKSIQDYFPEGDISQLDWPGIFADQFTDFHANFLEECKQRSTKYDLPPLWKCIGDEMVYACPVKDAGHANTLCDAFLTTIRNCDTKSHLSNNFNKNNILRMKGTAWIANFPIRNRLIRTPNNREDFLGQDIDIGFRIAKFAQPMTLCISMELAYLLGGADTMNQLVGEIVGWEPLKGIWGETPYPIIFAGPPGYTHEQASKDFFEWEWASCSHLTKWANLERIPDLKALKSKLTPTIQSLGQKLGVDEPYIYNEDISLIPQKQRDILDFLRLLHEKSTSQNAEPEPPIYGNESDVMTVLERFEGTQV